MVVATRLRAAFSGAGLLAELTGGVRYLDFLRALAQRMEADWAGVLADLEELRRRLFVRDGLTLNVTALPEQRDQTKALAEKLAQSFVRQGLAPDAAPDLSSLSFAAPAAEALLLPAQVNYTGKGVNLFDCGYVWHGSAAVILKFLRTGYLWEKVRVQGGAYGCMCGLDRLSGALYMVSYRDPGILPTLSVYDGTARYLQDHAPTREELNASIVGAIGELDAYLLPDAKGAAALTRRLCADTVERRQRLREEMLSTTPAHFREFGGALEAFTGQGILCVLGGNALEKLAAERGWTAHRVL
jgi:Zn-dependent M16 (insulinase) family peptidase